MSRSHERIIDAFVLMMLLVFAYLLRDEQPALAGVIVMASLKFWMDKNATAPETTLEENAALAAAKVLEVAREQVIFNQKTEEHRKVEIQPVEIVDQSDAIDVKVVE